MHWVEIADVLPENTLYAYARFSFSLDRASGGALTLGARGHAMAWLNGAYLGRTYVRSHPEEVRTECFDLATHLRRGKNVIALLLHGVGRAREDIPGVMPSVPIAFTTAGTAGTTDFSSMECWRLARAEEYRPAPRHNSLIGHSEMRDLRLEPVGWRLPPFEDSGWAVAIPRAAEAVEAVPSMLRPLAEQIAAPDCIALQGAWQAGYAAVSDPPTPEHRFWRIQTGSVGEATTFYAPVTVSSRFWIDGMDAGTRLHPPAPWIQIPHAVPLPGDGRCHCLEGELDRPCRFAWSHCPEGGDCVTWATDRDGPWVGGATEEDPDARPCHDAIMRENRAVLSGGGKVDLLVEDEVFAIYFIFPRSITLLPRLQFTGASAGVAIELVYSEEFIDRAGELLPAAYRDRVVLREGDQEYAVSFQYKSARVLGLIIDARGGRVRLEQVQAIYRHYAYDCVGAFACSDERLEGVWTICANTMEAGSQDAIVDGPWREQLLYIGDNQVHNPACYHLYGNHEIVEWQHTLYRQGQMEDGLFQPNQPCRTGPEEYRLLDQTILWPSQLAMHLLYTGREEFVRDHMTPMLRLLDGFQSRFGRQADGDPRLRDLTGWNWVDHPGLEGSMVRSIRHDGIPTAINLLYSLAPEAGVGLCRWAGRDEDGERLCALRERLHEKLRAQHWDGARAVYADCVVDGAPSPEVSAHVNLLAILSGLSDEADALLERTWGREDVLQPLGPFFRHVTFEVLHRLGRGEALLHEIHRTWGEFLDAGLTTTPEYALINGLSRASQGHPWGASPVIYLARTIAGVTPLAPGWRETRFCPRLCDLEWLHLTVPTPHGSLDLELEQDARGIRGVVRKPAGITIVTADVEVTRGIDIV